jgi:hypothetical protein
MFESQKIQLKPKKDVPEKIPPHQEIYVMPERFLKPERKIKIPSFIWISLGFLFLGLLAIFIVLWQQNLIFQKEKKPLQPLAKKEEGPTKPTFQEEEKEEEVSEIVFPLTSPAQTLEREIRDEKGDLIGSAKLILAAGSLDPPEAKIFLTGSLPGPLEKDHPYYQIVGGIYQVKSREPINFLKPAELILEYREEDLKELGIDELALELASLRDSNWQIEKSEVNLQEKTLKLVLEKPTSYSYALVVARDKIKREEKETLIVKTTLPSSWDSDRDGLTDEEEALFKTRRDLADTDGDSYPDGLEIVSLYNPLFGPEDRLALSGLVNSYTNSQYNYSLFYPSPWSVKPTDEEEREVIFTSATGEFVEVIVQENPQQLSASEWYLEVFPDLDPTELRRTKINNLYQAVWSPDGQSLYLAWQDKIYGLIYNSGLREDLNFKATFAMMIKSFRVLSGD